jgi:D-beta-D-heptose 7-phosphate kinase/D-beta-D-heptose 1-phosphate adenosyltransferase
MIESLAFFKNKNILVMGDFMLDSYTKGSVKRISPEAPVCILKVKKQERLPGGAGNVVLNCKALGSNVTALGRIGDDFASSYLKNDLEKAGVDTSGLIFEEGFETPLKNRFMAEYQQLLRVDFEKEQPLLEATYQHVMNFLKAHIGSFDLVVISDYNKGFLSKKLLQAVINLSIANNVPVFVDPKGHDFTKYEGATLIKPNLTEAYLASGFDDKVSLDEVGQKLLNVSKSQYILITRSEKGMSLFSNNLRQDYQARIKEVIDVTGAGDTVLATLAVTYASGLDLSSCIEWSNIAASCAIEKLGCCHVGKKQLIEAVCESDTKFKYLPNLIGDLVPIRVQGQKIKSFEISDKSLDFRLLSELSKYKSLNPTYTIAGIIPDDSEEDLIKSLCDLQSLDLIVPESLKQEVFGHDETLVPV